MGVWVCGCVGVWVCGCEGGGENFSVMLVPYIFCVL